MASETPKTNPERHLNEEGGIVDGLVQEQIKKMRASKKANKFEYITIDQPNVISADYVCPSQLIEFMAEFLADEKKFKEFMNHNCLHDHKYALKYEFCTDGLGTGIQVTCPNEKIGDPPCATADITCYENL